MTRVQELRGYPSAPNKDIYGLDTILELQTFDIQWTNQEEDPSSDTVGDLAGEQVDGFKNIADSIEALARLTAKQNKAQ